MMNPMNSMNSMNPNNLYDFLIIGAGVIGCAAARELARYQGKILVIEKEDDVASGISKANSGVLHAGFNVPPGTLKAKTNVLGHSRFAGLARELDFSIRTTEKLVVAMDDHERNHLEFLYQQGLKNGVGGLSLIDREEIEKLEPNIRGKYALRSAYAGIIEPYELVIALAENANENGVRFVFLEEVVAIDKDDSLFRVATSAGESYSSRWVINCAGIDSDHVSSLAAETEHIIHPCRGEYYITDKAEGLIERMIYPVPPAHGAGLGIHFTPTIEHNILLGPSAEYIEDRSDTATTAPVMATIKAQIEQYIPKLADLAFIRNYAGIRPKLISGNGKKEFADFVIEENGQVDRFIDLIGIESPGLTAAPAIAEMVVEIIGGKEDLAPNKAFNPYRESAARFALLPPEEQAALIERDAQARIMVCRCETVPQSEVIDAIENRLGATSLDAIKRRTRAMMGRCQGGFCTPRIVDLLIDRYGKQPEEIYKKNDNSKLFYGLIKDDRSP